jgi:hypothetical protein
VLFIFVNFLIRCEIKQRETQGQRDHGSMPGCDVLVDCNSRA